MRHPQSQDDEVNLRLVTEKLHTLFTRKGSSVSALSIRLIQTIKNVGQYFLHSFYNDESA